MSSRIIWKAGCLETCTSGLGLTDLNSLLDPDSGWVLKTATAINDRGEIVGWGEKDGETHAFLLQTVPGPASLAIWAGIGIVGGFVGWRRRVRGNCQAISGRTKG
jgi:hypothetical protein